MQLPSLIQDPEQSDKTFLTPGTPGDDASTFSLTIRVISKLKTNSECEMQLLSLIQNLEQSCRTLITPGTPRRSASTQPQPAKQELPYRSSRKLKRLHGR